MERLIAVALMLAAFGAGAATSVNVPAGHAVATFAGGCFWCMEPPYEKLPGVVAVVSGYTGGAKANPTYEQVSAGTTGHAEAVQITFDPDVFPYSKLLDLFWRQRAVTSSIGKPA